MDLQIEGKKAIMAGGSAGMGRATAERLAEAGAQLVISARREERLRNAAREISEQYGAAVTPVVADSSTEDGRAALFAARPDPDILAITIKPPKPNGDFLKVTPEQWRDSIETALIDPIEIMRHYIRKALSGLNCAALVAGGAVVHLNSKPQRWPRRSSI